MATRNKLQGAAAAAVAKKDPLYLIEIFAPLQFSNGVEIPVSSGMAYRHIDDPSPVQVKMKIIKSLDEWAAISPDHELITVGAEYKGMVEYNQRGLLNSVKAAADDSMDELNRIVELGLQTDSNVRQNSIQSEQVRIEWVNVPYIPGGVWWIMTIMFTAFCALVAYNLTGI